MKPNILVEFYVQENSIPRKRHETPQISKRKTNHQHGPNKFIRAFIMNITHEYRTHGRTFDGLQIQYARYSNPKSENHRKYSKLFATSPTCTTKKEIIINIK